MTGWTLADVRALTEREHADLIEYLNDAQTPD